MRARMARERTSMSESSMVSRAAPRVGLGILAALAGILCLTLNDTFGKLLGEGYDSWQIVLARSVLGLLPILVVLRQRGGASSLKVRSPLLHAVRAVCAVSAAYCFYEGLRHLALTECLAITFAGPICTTALSGPILKERVGARRWAVVMVGFAGVLLILRPGTSMFQPQALWPLTATVSYSLMMVLTRVLARTDSDAAILVWNMVGLAAAALPFTLRVWVTPAPADWITFLLLGLSGTGATYFLTVAYRHAPAAVVAPLDYTALLWGLGFGWMLWRELPDPAIWPGVAVLIGAGLYLIRSETRPGSG
jgi:drug/metabolite transporter (DMT)-like permease